MKKILVFLLIFTSCSWGEIRKHPGKTVGNIIDKLESAKGGYTLTYKYTVNDTIYEENDAIKIYRCNFENTFKGKYFHVVYSTINPEKSILLLTPDDYANWGYHFPDSLRWVTRCVGGGF